MKWLRPTLRHLLWEARGASIHSLRTGPYRCSLCGWREISEDRLLISIFDIQAQRPTLVCRNHPDIYGFFPVDCITGMTVHISRDTPIRGTIEWRRRWYWHEGRYWGFVVSRFIKELPEWAMSQIDWATYTLYHKYADWRKRAYVRYIDQ